jgi:hypothetical protein
MRSNCSFRTSLPAAEVLPTNVKDRKCRDEGYSNVGLNVKVGIEPEYSQFVSLLQSISRKFCRFITVLWQAVNIALLKIRNVYFLADITTVGGMQHVLHLGNFPVTNKHFLAVVLISHSYSAIIGDSALINIFGVSALEQQL